MLKFISFSIFFVLFLKGEVLYSLPEYSINISNTQILNDSTLSFDVYIKSIDSTIEITSYQCVFYIADEIPLYEFSYQINSSELKNLLPTVAIGVNNSEGKERLTFASLPGNEIINTKELMIGKFLLKTNLNNFETPPVIQWCFENKVSSILTGPDFNDITKPQNYSNEAVKKLNVYNVTASATSDTTTSPEKTIDGLCADDGDDLSRWASAPMPVFLIFDLGSEMYVHQTKFSFYKWNRGRIYHYAISSSTDLYNWDEIVRNDSSSSLEWTVNKVNTNARYLKLTFLSNNENSWAGLWEAEFYGSAIILDSTYSQLSDKGVLPNEYSLSQNYPNPFNPSTKIKFTLKESGRVSLDIFNILGERITTVIDKEMPAGPHEINFKGNNLASGIYIYRINVENRFTALKKMILTK